MSNGQYETLLTINAKFTEDDVLIGDIRNLKLVQKALSDVDHVVHLAAHTGVLDSIENPEETWDINVNGTFNLLEACRHKGIKKFIMASTNAVLGEQPPPANESRPPKPVSPYGASKLADEALCSAFHHSYGLDTVCLRFANCYGPFSAHKTSAIVKFMNLMRQNKPITIYGDGNQTRDFIHAEDVAHAIYLCLNNVDSGPTIEGISGETFQIGTGIETSINQLIELLKKASQQADPEGNWDVTVIHKPKRTGEIERNYSDITKVRTILGFEPGVKLERGLTELWARYTGAV
jgi:UDP-glucose 4-epimerase